MKAPMTRDRYKTRVAKFFDFIGIDEGKTLEEKARTFADRGKDDINWAFSNILKFIHFQKERVDRKEITAATVRNYVKSIKLFCEMADIPIPWKKITRGLPRGKKYADDRIPTLEEIRKLVEYPDRRIKAIVYTMASSGIRLGAWNYLQWGHIRPIERNDEIISAKIIVYAGEDEEYFTFISPEAWQSLEDWMTYRRTSGETIKDESWVMRDLWDTRVAQGRGLVTVPKKLSSLGVKRLMERAIWAQGLRKKLEPGKKRHPYQGSHSMRKWFKTRCEIAGMKPINIEKLMGHSVGISDSYYRATENEMLEDYLLAVNHLAISNDYSLDTDCRNIQAKKRQ
jgi:integrase